MSSYMVLLAANMISSLSIESIASAVTLAKMRSDSRVHVHQVLKLFVHIVSYVFHRSASVGSEGYAAVLSR